MTTLVRKHDQLHLLNKKQALRSPLDKEHTIRLYNYRATEENFMQMVRQLMHPECAIQRLELVKIRFNDKMASILAHGLSLDACTVKELIFEKCKVKFSAMNIAMQAMQKNCSIQGLEFNDQFIHEKQASVISEMLEVNKTIHKFTLNNCGLDDASMIQISSGLAHCSVITYLDVRNNQFEAQGLQSLMSALKQTSTIETLLLEDLEIGEGEEISSIQELFEDQSCKITHLSMSALGINEETSIKLINAVRQLKHLTTFCYKKNNCSLQFIQHFKQYINGGDLKDLDLSHCDINDEMFKQFCENLQTSNLTDLNISWNRLTNDACQPLRSLLENNQQLEKLFIQHNSFGGKKFHQLGSAFEYHKNLNYLDISYNNIQNEGFQHIFYPISRNKSQVEYLHCRGNDIGGPAADKLLYTISHHLKVLNLADNKLTELNGNILLDYAKCNPVIEQIVIDNNEEVNKDHIAIIQNDCRLNLQIKEFILPKLPKAKQTGFIHKSVGHNCYSDYDVTELAFTDMQFYKLDFVAKFMIQNKESFERLILKNIHIQARGIELTNLLKDKINKIDLKVIHIENVNFSEQGIKQMITSCKRMKHLRELALINMPVVADSMELIEKSFKNHKTLETLDLRNNQLPNFDGIVSILNQNKHIKKINIRGTKMSADNLGYIWFGLRENISVIDILYQRENVAFAFDVLQCVQIDINFNHEINKTIIPRVESSLGPKTDLQLNDTEILNIESVIKYVRKTSSLKSLDLSFTNLHSRAVEKLTIAIAVRQIHHLETLVLSRNITINDDLCVPMKALFRSSSNIKYLYLDQTSVTQAGVAELVSSIAENLKVHTLSFRNCNVDIYDQERHPEWDQILATLGQNCSLIKLDLAENEVSQHFKEAMNRELEKNQQIVDRIFPKLLEQEEEAQKQKKLSKSLKKKERLTNSRKKSCKTKKKVPKNSFFGDLLPSRTDNKTLQAVRPRQNQKKRQTEIGGTVTSNDLKRITQKQVELCLSVDDFASEKLEMIIDDKQSNKSGVSDGQDSDLSESEIEASKHSGPISITGEQGFELSLTGMDLKNLAFLTKFMTQFKKIKNVDIGDTKIQQKELGELTKAIQDNPYIQEFKHNQKHMSSKAKTLMKNELEKNREIQKYGATGLADKERANMKELDLIDQQVNVQAVSKMIRDYTALETLNLTSNILGNHGAVDLALMLEENNTLKTLVLKDCGIGNAGLQEICSALCRKGNNLEYLNIKGNPIPDKHLKMLLVLMYKNQFIHNIEYTLVEDKNIERREKYLEFANASIDSNLYKSVSSHGLHDHGHEIHYKMWEYVLFFPWLWKSMVHAKHDAFAFKYDPTIMLHLEENEMIPIRKMMYFWSIMYYIILFILPIVFKKQYCGGLFYNELYYIYAAYAILNAVWEVYVVFRIQNQIYEQLGKKAKAQKLLDFNRWHVVELFMGQIARLDTFMDFLFIIIIIDCEWHFKYFLIPSSLFMFTNLCFPLFMLTKIAFKKKSHLEHTMPYMESNNFLSFLRENMLLATVIDSFCINNCLSFWKSYKNKHGQKGVHVAFGRLMGGLSFFLQDFPQFTIHACFKIFYSDPIHYKLKKEPVLLISMFVSGAAVLISLFNLVMCVENEFDPVDLETALQKRRVQVAIKEKEDEDQRREKAAIESQKFKRQETKKDSKAFKRRMQEAFRKKILQDADEEEANAAKQAFKDDPNIKADSNLLGRFKKNAAKKSQIQKQNADVSFTKNKKIKMNVDSSNKSIGLTPFLPSESKQKMGKRKRSQTEQVTKNIEMAPVDSPTSNRELTAANLMSQYNEIMTTDNNVNEQKLKCHTPNENHSRTDAVNAAYDGNRDMLIQTRDEIASGNASIVSSQKNLHFQDRRTDHAMSKFGNYQSNSSSTPMLLDNNFDVDNAINAEKEEEDVLGVDFQQIKSVHLLSESDFQPGEQTNKLSRPLLSPGSSRPRFNDNVPLQIPEEDSGESYTIPNSRVTVEAETQPILASNSSHYPASPQSKVSNQQPTVSIEQRSGESSQALAGPSIEQSNAKEQLIQTKPKHLDKAAATKDSKINSVLPM